ncbi:uncharacterized protein LOC131605314 [Vicia villosa]|uniref:uncharacterized protein LOC131605314 n=1 Tax=Vicia villosa TaxID=3911 RepID=UPI00273CC4C0|nr:uncharacterized protein LOC131605314 [Vicia villosa]
MRHKDELFTLALQHDPYIEGLEEFIVHPKDINDLIVGYKWLDLGLIQDCGTEGDGVYTVASSYEACVKVLVESSDLQLDMAAMNLIWETFVPSKIHVFGWRALRNRLPSREQLAARGIITEESDMVCVFCFNDIESLNHLFVGCCEARNVWQKIASWLGIEVGNADDVVEHMFYFEESIKGLVSKRKRLLVWLAAVWALWWMRNEIIFNEQEYHEDEVVHKTISLAWLWNMIGVKSDTVSNFYLWSYCPVQFLNG